MGEMSMVNLVTCLFHSFEALNDAFEVHIFHASFYTKTLIACRAMQLRFLKLKTLFKQCL